MEVKVFWAFDEVWLRDSSHVTEKTTDRRRASFKLFELESEEEKERRTSLNFGKQGSNTLTAWGN